MPVSNLFLSIAVAFSLLQLSSSAQLPPQNTAVRFSSAAEVMQAFQHSPYSPMAQGRVAHTTLLQGMYALVDPTGRTHPIYIDEHVKIMKNGSQPWYDVASGQPLPAGRQLEIRKHMVEHIALSEAIAFQYGTGAKREIVVSAYDCPFCRNVERTLDQKQPDMTVYVFPSTLDHTNAQRMEEAYAIRCSDDPKQAWKAAVLKGVKPASSHADCTKDPSDIETFEYLFGIRSYPSRIEDDGSVSIMRADAL